jgi:PhzF family phenazine biosynthesis protein
MDVLRYVAFATEPSGGNPAGVVLDATGADESAMAAVAADVGYSETAFVVPRRDGELDVRYFSPLAEVPFCGHATIATAVAYAQRHGVGELAFHTRAGLVRVGTWTEQDGTVRAELVSVGPKSEPLPDRDLAELLAALRWSADDLDPSLPPRVAYAGAWHPVIAVSTRTRLAALDYDMAALGDLMKLRDWTTVDLVWRESDRVFHARNPFPPGGVVEDPATGAAAAAFGGYLRELGLVDLPATLTVHQGDDMGRPGVLTVRIPPDAGSGIAVSGAAVPIPHQLY